MSPDAPEVSFVLPCLNEARTLQPCIAGVRRCIELNALDAEIIIADNGSTDGSQALARELGARVIDVPQRGYGAALAAGFAAARGRFIVMGDADDSYDFEESIGLIRKLREGCDLVMGSRFSARGGGIQRGAMPWKHRYIGNPALSAIGRLLFRSPVEDFHCGLRALTRRAALDLDLHTPGMEFASEMVVKATLRGMRIGEAPVTLRKDGRDRPPHLRSWRDGWRHLVFMLCLSPRWTLFIPGAALLALGAALMIAVGAGPLTVAGTRLDVHTLVAASLMMLVGHQAVLAAGAVRLYTLESQIGPARRGVRRAFGWLTPGRGMLIASGLMFVGALVIALPVRAWILADLGDLDAARTLRPMMIGATLVALGAQTGLMSFLYAMLRMGRA